MSDADALLNYSPFSTTPGCKDGRKRSAEETPSLSASKSTEHKDKRPTILKVGEEDDSTNTTTPITLSFGNPETLVSPVPNMSKEDAEKIVKSLVLPKALKKQSEYARFKSALLKNSKVCGDTSTIENITSVAKSAWEMVKWERPTKSDIALNPNGSDSSESESKNVSYLRIRADCLDEEKNEASRYAEELEKFKSNYLDASVALLQWYTIIINKANVKTLENEISIMHTKAFTAWSSNCPQSFLEAYQKTMDQIKILKEENAINDLVEKLSSASRAELVEHAKEYHKLMIKADELNKIKVIENAVEMEKQKTEENALKSASKIKPEIIRSLKKQMVYTNSNLRFKAANISYRRGGVSTKLFAAAFGVEEGTKTYTFSGDEVGLKSLRYGYLECDVVKVKLMGEDLIASSSYLVKR